MHQLKVFRCNVCMAPFLFESDLDDHKRDHMPKDIPSKPAKKRAARRKSA